jgi:ABC-2 type transport system ATP-binding protein
MLIECRDLVKAFGRRRAVAGISFGLGAGTIAAFLGSNGAGKSTTMRLLAGYLAPDAGHAHIAGYDVVRDSARARAALGYLPEAASGFGHLTVHEFLLCVAECRGLWGHARAAALARAVAAVELDDAMDLTLSSLSKGWRQRAWLAQAILHDPPVLILDEPTDGLDPNQKARLHRFIRSIAPGRAVLMSTHILEEAEAICDRVIVMSEGRILADAPRADLVDARGRLAPAFARLTAATPEPAVL